jgi:hypothetical protein
MGETLKRRVGPLPMWAWALIFVVVLGMYLSYRKSKAANAAAAAAAQQGVSSTNLGTTPVSNLVQTAQPMPVQLGDTFVSVPQSINTNTTTTVPITVKPPPSSSMQPAPAPAAPPAPAVPAPKQPGYGLVNTVQGLMVWLGVNQPGSKIYNVGGGAPVYFGNASALAQGGQYEKAGYDIYTPVGYAQQVASTPLPLSQAYT